MQLLRPSPQQAAAGFRAIAQVARVVPLGPAGRAVISAAQSALLGTAYDLDTAAPIAPEALAEALDDPALRDQIIQGMLVISLADGMPDPARLELIRDYARAMDVQDEALDVITRLAHRQMVLFKLDFYRRSHLRSIFEDQYAHHGGLPGLARSMLGVRGLMEDPEVAARYQAMEQLPADTLGHAWFHHCRQNGFALPGERKGFPEAGVYHDLSHVLSGYGADPIGETLVASFTGGYRKERPFFVVLFTLLTFSSGVNMTPLPQPDVLGTIGQPGVAARWIRAIERGSLVNTDLSDNWDYWPYMTMKLEEAREALHVVPE